MQKSIKNDQREGLGEDTYQTEETQQSEKELGHKNQCEMIPEQVR